MLKTNIGDAFPNGRYFYTSQSTRLFHSIGCLKEIAQMWFLIAYDVAV